MYKYNFDVSEKASQPITLNDPYNIMYLQTTMIVGILLWRELPEIKSGRDQVDSEPEATSDNLFGESNNRTIPN
jgi:hypothetical protein